MRKKNLVVDVVKAFDKVNDVCKRNNENSSKLVQNSLAGVDGFDLGCILHKPLLFKDKFQSACITAILSKMKIYF